jgi:hypothetical protein
MALEDVYRQLVNRSGMFSPLSPFRSEKRLARELAPDVIRGVSGQAMAGISARGDMASSVLRGRSNERVARIGGGFDLQRQELQNVGDLARQKLMNYGNQILQDLQNKGLMARTREEVGGAAARQKAEIEFQQKFADLLTGLGEGKGEGEETTGVDIDGVLDDLFGSRGEGEQGTAFPSELVSPRNRKEKRTIVPLDIPEWTEEFSNSF